MCQCSCEDLELDESLSFLSEISSQAIEKGAPLYCAPLDLDDVSPTHGEGVGSLKFAHYSAPGSSSPGVPAGLEGPVPDLAETIQQQSGNSFENRSPGPVDVMQHSNPMEVLKLKAKGSTKVWGAGGTVETDWSKTKPSASSANALPPPSLPTVPDFATIATGKQPIAVSSAEKKEVQQPKQKTPEEVKKEKMAAALFGRISDTHTSGRDVTRSRLGHQSGRVGDGSKMSSTASGETGRNKASQDLLDMSFDMPGDGTEERGDSMKDKSGACISSSLPLRHTVQSMGHSAVDSNSNVFEGMAVKPITIEDHNTTNVFEGMTIKPSAVEELSTLVDLIHVSPCADGRRLGDDNSSQANLLDMEGIQSQDNVPEVEIQREYTMPKGSELGRSQNNVSGKTFSKDLMGSTTTTTLSGGGGTEGQHSTTTTTTTTFKWNGHTMQPLLIDTHEFGEDWTGSNMIERTLIGLKCGQQHTFRTPEDIMQALEWYGLHPVESIPSTGEGICAGTCSDIRLLVHFKLQPQYAVVDLTVHCHDGNIVDAFLFHLKQNIGSTSSIENNNINY